MKESKEIRELRGKILGMEMELNLLSKDLERFKIELIYNKKVLEKIDENIDFLRKSKAAVSLSEYKKIKQQRNLVEMRIKYYKNKVQPLEQLLNRKEIYHKEEMKKFENIYRLQFVDNVLEFPIHGRKTKKNI